VESRRTTAHLALIWMPCVEPPPPVGSLGALNRASSGRSNSANSLRTVRRIAVSIRRTASSSRSSPSMRTVKIVRGPSVEATLASFGADSTKDIVAEMTRLTRLSDGDFRNKRNSCRHDSLSTACLPNSLTAVFGGWFYVSREDDWQWCRNAHASLLERWASGEQRSLPVRLPVRRWLPISLWISSSRPRRGAVMVATAERRQVEAADETACGDEDLTCHAATADDDRAAASQRAANPSAPPYRSASCPCSSSRACW
jgi:hypothetical protein